MQDSHLVKHQLSIRIQIHLIQNQQKILRTRAQQQKEKKDLKLSNTFVENIYSNFCLKNNIPMCEARVLILEELNKQRESQNDWTTYVR